MADHGRSAGNGLPHDQVRVPRPAYWCRHGYAVANVDPRGVGHSQGDINMFGTQDGRDGYDFIEWLATQYWCNGKVGMSGNSGVAMTQWRIAAEQPPHLTCIAPWEGTGDLYRESLYEGGIPALGFNDFIVGSLIGSRVCGRQRGHGQGVPFHECLLGRQDPEVAKHQDSYVHDGLLEPLSPAGLHGRLQKDPVTQRSGSERTGSSSGPTPTAPRAWRT